MTRPPDPLVLVAWLSWAFPAREPAVRPASISRRPDRGALP